MEGNAVKRSNVFKRLDTIKMQSNILKRDTTPSPKHNKSPKHKVSMAKNNDDLKAYQPFKSKNEARANFKRQATVRKSS